MVGINPARDPLRVSFDPLRTWRLLQSGHSMYQFTDSTTFLRSVETVGLPLDSNALSSMLPSTLAHENETWLRELDIPLTECPAEEDLGPSRSRSSHYRLRRNH